MTKNLCDQVHEFVDGELDAHQAEKFRDHLVNCPACQQELEDALQLGWLTAELHASQASGVVLDKSGTDTGPIDKPVDC